MYAKCKMCERMWNISTLQKIPKHGYICPWCENLMRRSMRNIPKKEKSENKKENSLLEKVDGLHRSYSSQSYLLRISERYALRNKGKRRTRIRMDSNPAHVGVGIRIDQIRCRRCILKAPDA